MGKEERQIVIDRAAEEELEAAAAWYDDEDPGLGRDLLTAVEETFYLVRRFPSIGVSAPGNRDVRRVLVEGFPYAVVYRDLDAAIHIIAVAHTKRRPGYWRLR